MRDKHSSEILSVASTRNLIGPRVSTSIKFIRFELKEREMCNALPDKATLDKIHMAQINILRSLIWIK